MGYTVNIRDPNKEGMELAKAAGYHAYHARGVTAIETLAKEPDKAENIAQDFGEVLYVFE